MIGDLALILIVAAIVTLIFKRLKQPLVLGYIVAGFLVSPHFPYMMSVIDKSNVQEWADIGVMFLLFSLGLDFSFKKIVKMGAAPIISAITIVACMMMLGYTVGHLFGWGHIDCIFLGGMLAMSSTTIIYKAFDDLGLRQQRFASLVMSVLILEDILAIVMMVMLSAIASGDQLNGSDMLLAVGKIGFFLILWFVIGIFAVPLILRQTRKLMTAETLLIVALGLCCLMATVSKHSGFSEAFGAFVMGSILAETIEAEKIEKIIDPVKNLFGAVFFVSVGMLVDPVVLVDYSLPILVLVLTIIVGQAVFGTIGYFLSGQTLHTAMRCGFSMAQIGEFAFIIASLGMSMHVIAPYLYPVVVAVSVITTFITPYMIRGAEPAYQFLEKHLPKSLILSINSLTTKNHDVEDNVTDTDETPSQLWKKLLKSMAINTLVYSILIFAVVYLMLSFFLIFSRTILPHWWANGLTGVVTVLIISPFMRSIVMKKNHSEEWKQLWSMSAMYRLPLISTIVARAAVCLAFLFYICNYLARFANAIVICLGIVVIAIIALSQYIKKHSIRLEKMFMKNLRSRDVAAQARGTKLPDYATSLVERDIHIAELVVPEQTAWAGQSLKELQLGKNYGIHVSSILRNGHRINIPFGVEQIFPGDKIQVIGSDTQITKVNEAMTTTLAYSDDDYDIEAHEMVLRQIDVTAEMPFVGKSLRDSRLREDYLLLVVGIEEGQPNLTQINSNHVFEVGDKVWMVGELTSFKHLLTKKS